MPGGYKNSKVIFSKSTLNSHVFRPVILGPQVGNNEHKIYICKSQTKIRKSIIKKYIC